jgi:peroxiredoxin
MKEYLPAFFWLLVLFVFFACTEQAARNDQEVLTLKGKIENAPNISLFFEELTPSDILPIDSIYTDDQGKFSFDFFMEDASFFRFGISSSNFITLSLEPYESVEIYADARDIASTYSVKGSPGSTILWELNQNRIKGMKVVDSLRNIYHESQQYSNFPQIREELKKSYKAVKSDQVDFILQVVDKNSTNLASILALYQHLDDKLLIRESEHFDYFQKLSKTLCSSYPTNKHVMDLKKRVNEHKRAEEQRLENERNLANGMPAPDITLPDTNGQLVSLSSLRGNVVLIDFWAAWCPPCRKANTALVEIYKEHNPRGFEIYGVSLDRTRDQWLKAIETDNLTWVQVSDLRFMNSPVVSLYNVQNIPYNILLNREGKIVARNLSPEEIGQHLRELL